MTEPTASSSHSGGILCPSCQKFNELLVDVVVTYPDIKKSVLSKVIGANLNSFLILGMSNYLLIIKLSINVLSLISKGS